MDDISVGDNDSDGVCLDGQRLFYLQTTSGVTSFETEYKDFSSITTNGSGVFSVVTKSGEMRVYGLTEHGRVLFPKEDSVGIIPPDAGAAGTVTAVWALEEVVDPWGNYFEIHYNNDKNDSTDQSDFQNRGLIVTEIKYTAHWDAQGKKDVDPFNSITFSYDEPGGQHPRPDVRITRFRDSVLPVKSRLKTITTERGTYSLIYKGEDPMLPSRLSEIDYCAGTTCLEPLIFGWKEGGYQWESSAAYKLPTAIHGAGTQFVDLDGDGLLDFVQARATTWQSYGARRTWKNTGSGWVEKSNWALPDFISDAAGKMRGGAFVDIDGDGLPDFVTDRWDTYCSSCTSTTQGYPWSCSTGSCATTAHPNGNYGGSILLDRVSSPAIYLNRTREGLGWVKDTAHSDSAMIAAIASMNKGMYTFSGGMLYADWVFPHLVADDGGPGGRQDYLADIDGDGRPDLIHIGKYESVPNMLGLPCQSRVDVLLNKESGWVADESYSVLSSAQGGVCIPGKYIVRDVNRDGLADLVTDDSYGASRKVFINTGKKDSGDYGGLNTGLANIWKMASNTGIPPWPADQQPNLVNYGDIDGDGQLDTLTQAWDAKANGGGATVCPGEPL
jgi:hypothetical protein